MTHQFKLAYRRTIINKKRQPQNDVISEIMLLFRRINRPASLPLTDMMDIRKNIADFQLLGINRSTRVPPDGNLEISSPGDFGKFKRILR